MLLLQIGERPLRRDQDQPIWNAKESIVSGSIR